MAVLLERRKMRRLPPGHDPPRPGRAERRILNGAQYPVAPELLKVQLRIGRHRFPGGIGPGLHAECLRWTALITELLPDSRLRRQVGRGEYQGGLALQVAGHLLDLAHESL